MLNQPIDATIAARLEQADVQAWRDMYEAMPSEFANRFGAELLRFEDVVLTRCPAIPFVHFNNVLNLGVYSPASERQLDEILAFYQAAGIANFAIQHNPFCEPNALRDWFAARKLQPHGAWERIFRDDAPLEMPRDMSASPWRVEKVNRTTATEWAAFIDGLYDLPTSPWLLALAERIGWHHYMLRTARSDKLGAADSVWAIVAVRSLYVHPEGGAWLGIDAPVPGLMAPTFEEDLQLCRAIVADGLVLGARYFVADIEAPSPDSPAYRNFAALGFQRAYLRTQYGF